MAYKIFSVALMPHYVMKRQNLQGRIGATLAGGPTAILSSHIDQLGSQDLWKSS